MEICFFITHYWLSHGHNLTVVWRYRAIFFNFFRLFRFFLLEFLSNTYKNLFWWFVGKKMHLSKKKFDLFIKISNYKGVSKEMVPKHCFWIFSFSFVIFSHFFLFWSLIFITKLKIHWKYIISNKKNISRAKKSFFHIMSRGQPYPKILKKKVKNQN